MHLIVHKSSVAGLLQAGEAHEQPLRSDAARVETSCFVELAPTDRLDVPGRALETPSAMVVLDRNHRVVACASEFQGRPSLYRASFERNEATWRSAGEGWISPRILEGPGDDYWPLSAPGHLLVHEVAIGVWAALLIAGRRAMTVTEAVTQAEQLVASNGITAEPTESLQAWADTLLRDSLSQGR
jgi:hypothetical protein